MSESFETLRVAREPQGIVVCTFHRPEVRNAMSKEMVDELRALLADIRGDSAVRVVIFTGVGKSFISGADIAELRDRDRIDGNGCRARWFCLRRHSRRRADPAILHQPRSGCSRTRHIAIRHRHTCRHRDTGKQPGARYRAPGYAKRDDGHHRSRWARSGRVQRLCRLQRGRKRAALHGMVPVD